MALLQLPQGCGGGTRADKEPAAEPGAPPGKRRPSRGNGLCPGAEEEQWCRRGWPGAEGHTPRGRSDAARLSSLREARLGGPVGLHAGQTGLPGAGQMLSWALEMDVGGRVLGAPLRGCRNAPTAHPALTVGQQVEHQLLVPTEAGVVPEGMGRGRRQARRPPPRSPHSLPARHSQGVLPHSPLPGTHRGVLPHSALPGTHRGCCPTPPCPALTGGCCPTCPARSPPLLAAPADTWQGGRG